MNETCPKYLMFLLYFNNGFKISVMFSLFCKLYFNVISKLWPKEGITKLYLEKKKKKDNTLFKDI